MDIKTILEKWSENRILVIFILIFFYPLGVYLMHKGEHFNPDLRRMLTWGFLFIWVFMLARCEANKPMPLEPNPQNCTATFYENGCTYYRDSDCHVFAQECD